MNNWKQFFLAGGLLWGALAALMAQTRPGTQPRQPIYPPGYGPGGGQGGQIGGGQIGNNGMQGGGQFGGGQFGFNGGQLGQMGQFGGGQMGMAGFGGQMGAGGMGGASQGGGASGVNNPFGAYIPGTVVRPNGPSGPFTVIPIPSGYMLGGSGGSFQGGQMGMGGMAITMDLRLDQSSGALPKVPVLMLLDRVADVHMARRSGADGWTIKPLDSLRLRKAVTAIAGGGCYAEGIPTPDVEEEVVEEASATEEVAAEAIETAETVAP